MFGQINQNQYLCWRNLAVGGCAASISHMELELYKTDDKVIIPIGWYTVKVNADSVRNLNSVHSMLFSARSRLRHETAFKASAQN